jgi:LPXTG-motif cell wall-anchored protein
MWLLASVAAAAVASALVWTAPAHANPQFDLTWYPFGLGDSTDSALVVSAQITPAFSGNGTYQVSAVSFPTSSHPEFLSTDCLVRAGNGDPGPGPQPTNEWLTGATGNVTQTTPFQIDFIDKEVVGTFTVSNLVPGPAAIWFYCDESGVGEVAGFVRANIPDPNATTTTAPPDSSTTTTIAATTTSAAAATTSAPTGGGVLPQTGPSSQTTHIAWLAAVAVALGVGAITLARRTG